MSDFTAWEWVKVTFGFELSHVAKMEKAGTHSVAGEVQDNGVVYV